jgi:Domain of unknown function (DUF6484)
MNPNDLPDAFSFFPEAVAYDAADTTSVLLRGATHGSAGALPGPIHGALVGELIALAEEGALPLVRFPGQPGEAAIAAQSTVDLQGQHIGQPIVLLFEQGNAARPIVMGVLRGAAGWPIAGKPSQVDVDADGQRLIVNAKEQLVLRCGKASITLTKAGKVLIEGSYVLSRSTGLNRVWGGSVEIN